MTFPVITDRKLVLVMLDDDVYSPCYTFQSNLKRRTRLSPKNLRDILLWATEIEPQVPELLFLTGAEDEPLDPDVASVLEDMEDQVIVPLVPIGKQSSLSIPFSSNQTVIVRDLNEVVSQVDNIAGRPIILHVERDEINKLAETLLPLQDSIGAVTLRLRDINLLGEYELKAYEKQLASIADVGLMKQATRTEGKFRLLNLNAMDQTTNQFARCPAGTNFITIGPDASVYPCPAFFHAGREPLVETIFNMEKKLLKTNLNEQQCSFCKSTRCPGCRFLESSELVGKEQICKIYEAQNHATQELLKRVVQSGYLFDCLRTLKARECALKSQNEGGESLVVGQQVYDVKFNEFIQALQDLKLAAESVEDKTTGNDNYDAILNRWPELLEIPSSSQRNIFRRRVREALVELKQLAYIASTTKQKDLRWKKRTCENEKTVQKEREPIMEMEAQMIPDDSLATILSLHRRRLGWTYLLENTIADREVGFPCEKEEFAIRRELRKAVFEVSKWFRDTGQRYNWPYREGWIWEIDFKEHKAVPKKQVSRQDDREQEQNNSDSIPLPEDPIMTLGDIDVDIIKRLLEMRDAHADNVRSNLRHFLNGEHDIDKLNKMVEQLGAADKDVRDWFSEMATTYKWPSLSDNKWLYRVDIKEKMVYLTRR